MGKKNRQKQQALQAKQAEAARQSSPPQSGGEAKATAARFNFNWIGYTPLWFTLSTLIIILGISSMVYKGMTTGQPLNWGIDFTGGTVMTLRIPRLAEIKGSAPAQEDETRRQVVADVRAVLSQIGLADSLIQTSEGDVTVRSRPLTNEERMTVSKSLADQYSAQLIEVDTIGPTIGRQLQRQAVLILLSAVVLLILYISIRFEPVYALAAILADLHDAFVMLGMASLLGIEINIVFMAALLTILGYSINDTIIVFDRIRENNKTMRRENFAAIANLSLNQTLNRTINTVATTLLAVAAILIFGGSTIKPFALAIFIGLISGTYSSICNASPFLVIFKKR